MGHEFCGTIAEVPQGSRLKPGQKVMCDPRLYCRSCSACDIGQTNSCRKFGFLGLTGGGGGGLSEFVAVDEDQVYTLPDDAPLEIAALMEPLAVAWHGVSTSGVPVPVSEPVLILGGGPIGLAAAIVLRARGATNIVVSEPGAQRRQLASELADVVLNPREDNVAAKMHEMTGGWGVALVMDCAGIQAALMDGFQSLCIKGVYLNLAAWENDVGTPLTSRPPLR